MADIPPGDDTVPEPAGARKPGQAKKPPGKDQAPAPDPIDDDGDSQGGDSDDLDDFEFEGDYGKTTALMKFGYVILLAGMAFMIGYLVLIVIYPDRFATQDWIGGKSKKKEAVSIEVDLTLIKSFQIGGLRLGYTPEEARRAFPSIRLTATPSFGPSDRGAQIGYYRHHDGDYQAFFRGPEKGNRLFKVESRHTYSEISYLELLTELSGRYGKPQKSDCGPLEGEIGIRCELYWRMSETLLKARILTAAPKGGGDSVTELFVQARDTRPNLYFFRLKAQQEARTEKGPKKKKSLKDLRPGN